MTKEEQQNWIGFAKAAARSYQPHDDIETLEELVEDMADVSSSYADLMMDECASRFDGKSTKRRSRSKRRRDEEPEE